ncbi:hypothetical protein GCM10009535_17430 [Streptomyces thermocarboxydovorans]|uniref:Uncharacterized protein n=1 Tax=Streptomyces thermocarboxydovorans TaxID=59298 RepID=A0ABN1HE17_9ACTN
MTSEEPMPAPHPPRTPVSPSADTTAIALLLTRRCTAARPKSGAPRHPKRFDYRIMVYTT